jgi:hypothetical protein
MEYIGIKKFETDNPHPIKLKTEERIILEKEYDSNEDWPNRFIVKNGRIK